MWCPYKQGDIKELQKKSKKELQTGNKLLNHTFHYDTRKYSYSARIVNTWNSLPNSVVEVDTVCLFKAHLDKFWMHQDVGRGILQNAERRMQEVVKG